MNKGFFKRKVDWQGVGVNYGTLDRKFKNAIRKDHCEVCNVEWDGDHERFHIHHHFKSDGSIAKHFDLRHIVTLCPRCHIWTQESSKGRPEYIEITLKIEKVLLENGLSPSDLDKMKNRIYDWKANEVSNLEYALKIGGFIKW